MAVREIRNAATRALLLIRHGALPPNPERRFIGAQDIPLSGTGRAQIRALGQELAAELRDRPPTAIISSDLARCRETADILTKAFAPVAGGASSHADAGFREISLGVWQGRTVEEIEKSFPGQYAQRGRDMAGFCPAGGENFITVRQRALAAMERWRTRYPEGILLIVAHAGINAVLIAQYLSLPMTDLVRIPQPYACRTWLNDV
ncbi:MAG: phosphoglycerate mutase [Candidatus Desulfovibrio kirbyi]|uniref:Phosphoglycerate mutase n=1 Tax=Candidatus Desulfovibrio kirbyi TaxID=2696086 RepID=A0A6L2R6G1_9BACT|nr:MAG: phosphoglycerate mutase [Candidatus Desulfovibrio kirbyi]